jgi:hypothetical protein
MKKYIPYGAVIVATVAALALVAVLLTGGGGASKEDKAGSILTSTFNADKSNAAAGVTIVNVQECKDVSGAQGAPENTYACTAQVGGVKAEVSCDGFIFTTDAEQKKITNLIYAQPIDPSNCTGA